MRMDEVAPESINAEVVFAEIFTLLSLVLNVSLIVFEKLVTPMCKFASFLVGTKPTFHESSAQF